MQPKITSIVHPNENDQTVFLPFQGSISRYHEVLVCDNAQEQLQSTTLNKVRLELHTGRLTTVNRRHQQGLDQL